MLASAATGSAVGLKLANLNIEHSDNCIVIRRCLDMRRTSSLYPAYLYVVDVEWGFYNRSLALQIELRWVYDESSGSRTTSARSSGDDCLSAC